MNFYPPLIKRQRAARKAVDETCRTDGCFCISMVLLSSSPVSGLCVPAQHAISQSTYIYLPDHITCASVWTASQQRTQCSLLPAWLLVWLTGEGRQRHNSINTDKAASFWWRSSCISVRARRQVAIVQTSSLTFHHAAISGTPSYPPVVSCYTGFPSRPLANSGLIAAVLMMGNHHMRCRYMHR